MANGQGLSCAEGVKWLILGLVVLFMTVSFLTVPDAPVRRDPSALFLEPWMNVSVMYAVLLIYNHRSIASGLRWLRRLLLALLP